MKIAIRTNALLLAAGLACSAHAQNPPADMCTFSPCQKDVQVSLKLDDGSRFERRYPLLPGAVQPRSLNVVAGQTLYIEAELENGRLVRYRQVTAINSPGKTIVLRLWQEDNGMILSVKNPFGETIKFDMAIMPMREEDLFKTSSCPVIAHGESYEMWPEALFQVVLMGGRTQGASHSMACEAY